MTIDHVSDVVMAVLAVRVFTPDAVRLIRRVAAAGVRAGVDQMHCDRRAEGRAQR